MGSSPRIEFQTGIITSRNPKQWTTIWVPMRIWLSLWNSISPLNIWANYYNSQTWTKVILAKIALQSPFLGLQRSFIFHGFGGPKMHDVFVGSTWNHSVTSGGANAGDFRPWVRTNPIPSMGRTAINSTYVDGWLLMVHYSDLFVRCLEKVNKQNIPNGGEA